jgi:hypothetical protein
MIEVMANDHVFSRTEMAYFCTHRVHQGDWVQFPDDINLDMRSTPLSYLCFCVELHAFHMREEIPSKCGAVILSWILMRWGCFNWWTKINSRWMVSCQDDGRHIFNIFGCAFIGLGPVTTELLSGQWEECVQVGL